MHSLQTGCKLKRAASADLHVEQSRIDALAR